jgi:hypothetical protein
VCGDLLLAGAALTLALFAAALLALMFALLTLAARAGLFVGGRHRVHASTHDRSGRPRGSTHDRTGRADDGTDQATLEHDGSRKDCGQGCGTGQGSDHGLHLA